MEGTGGGVTGFGPTAGGGVSGFGYEGGGVMTGLGIYVGGGVGLGAGMVGRTGRMGRGGIGGTGGFCGRGAGVGVRGCFGFEKNQVITATATIKRIITRSVIGITSFSA